MVKSLQTGKCTQSEYSFRRRHITCMHVKKSTQSTWYFIPQYLQGLLEIRLPIAAPCQLLASHSNGSAWYPLCSRAWCSFSYSPHTAALMFCVSAYEYERNNVCEWNRIWYQQEDIHRTTEHFGISKSLENCFVSFYFPVERELQDLTSHSSAVRMPLAISWF